MLTRSYWSPALGLVMSDGLVRTETKIGHARSETDVTDPRESKPVNRPYNRGNVQQVESRLFDEEGGEEPSEPS